VAHRGETADVALMAGPEQRAEQDLARAYDRRLTIVGGFADLQVGETDVDEPARRDRGPRARRKNVGE
jgi:hypothetical protein